MIDVRNVTKIYKKEKALDGFSYGFEEGNAYGILGINGAGKSTLIGCITGNLAYEGEISYGEWKPWDMGYMPQELAIYPDLSVWDNMLFFAAAYKVPKAEARSRAQSLLERVGLWEKKDALARELSGGMKRKLNLVTGLIHSPRIIICDEICVGIDPISRKEILELLKELNGSGMTLLYTSHYLDEVEYLCNRILFLHGGRLLLEGDREELVGTIAQGEDPNLSDVFMKVLRKDGV